jgi:hypothetical protein
MFTSRLRAAARYVLLTAAVVSNGAPATTIAVTPAREDRSTTVSQVRLRKLHLVRPDLIPYPMAYAVYC